MLNSKLMSDLRKMITKHFGGVSGCARELGVTRQTVMNWTVKNPRGMLKYAPEIVSRKDLTWTQLSAEVMYAEGLLNDETST